MDLKWSDQNFADIAAGSMPDVDSELTTSNWEKGDVDAAMAEADLVLEEAIVHQSVSHHPMEPRSTMAYWENGRLVIHVSTQSAQRAKQTVAGIFDMDEGDVTCIAEYCGGGFGGKIAGTTHMVIAPLLARKIGRPVMHRVTRYEENYLGRARPGFQSWVKMGFRADGKVTAIDLITVQDSGPYGAGDLNLSLIHISEPTRPY